MTPKQKLFADEYIKSSNPAEAYMTAYSSVKIYEKALLYAQKLLKNDEVKNYIHNNTIYNSADVNEVKKFWTEILRNKDEKLSDRMKASEFIARSNGLFIDKFEVKDAMTVKIINDIPQNKDLNQKSSGDSID